MRRRNLYLLLLAGMLFSQCANKYKLVYNIPDATPDAEREALMETINKGKKLFKANCAECHGVFNKGKDNVPNFTNAQINNYSARVLRRDPKIHGAVLKMSAEQMNDVLTFLRYKKPENSAQTRKH